MRVNREELLKAIQTVSPGITSKELTEQSSCVAFRDGRIWTFNEEIACYAASPLGDFAGAIVAKPLIDLLSRMEDTEIEVMTNPENTLLRIRKADDGNKKQRRMAEMAMQAEVLLPIDAIEKPEVWHPLDQAEFANAVRLTAACASTNPKEFVYSCIHIKGDTEDGQPGFLESCDRLQIGRWPMSIKLEHSAEVLVRAVSLAEIACLKIVEIAETGSWLHFRNADGVVLACRKFIDNFADLTPFIDKQGASKLTLPQTLDGILGRAAIFTQAASVGSFVHVKLTPATEVVMGSPRGTLTISGSGPTGRYIEHVEVVYDGPATEFIINPALLLELAKKSSDCWILPGKLFVDSTTFYYFTCTEDPAKLNPVEVVKEKPAV